MNISNGVILLTVNMLIEGKFAFKKIIILRREFGIQYSFGCESNATTECVIIEYSFYPLVSSGVIPLNAVIYYTVFVDSFVGVNSSSALNKCFITSSSTPVAFYVSTYSVDVYVNSA